MNHIAKAETKPRNVAGNWVNLIDKAIVEAETAELELSREGGSDPFEQRKSTGSYYTPADVADHFWDLFFRHHNIRDLSALLKFVALNELVEPSAGSGMFVFSFLKKAAKLGATPQCLAGLRFRVVDINLAALRFFSDRLKEIENGVGLHFDGVSLVQDDFIKWANANTASDVIFVGNPPFVTNPRGARWRNLYADFVETMLSYRGVKGISLIVPLSVCFSRDYADLRAKIQALGMGISVSSYDNIPDSLFKTGKPDSANTNRANSQRCTILNVGGPNPTIREASALLNWFAAERASFLSTTPAFRTFSDEDPSRQIPRPASDQLSKYLGDTRGVQPLRVFLSKIGKPVFSISAVARNYIGIRDFENFTPGCIPIRVNSKDELALVLQIVSSNLFYEYWRTYGDGFHVTVDLVERFPVSTALAQHCLQNLAVAHRVWAARTAYAKEKLNSGKLVRSYDFRSAFDYVAPRN